MEEEHPLMECIVSAISDSNARCLAAHGTLPRYPLLARDVIAALRGWLLEHPGPLHEAGDRGEWADGYRAAAGATREALDGAVASFHRIATANDAARSVAAGNEA